MSKKEKKLNEEWLIKDRHPEFASWLVKGKENTQAKCKLCHKVTKLSNMGIEALKSHQKGRKHISVVSICLVFSNLLLLKIHPFQLKSLLRKLMTVPHQNSKPWY